MSQVTSRTVTAPDGTVGPVRTAALWVPDWPVLAAMRDVVDAHTPAAVHDGRRVTAASAPARRQGVRRGMRRRHAQECCPELVLLSPDPGREVRFFEPVATAAEEVVAGVEVVRPGLLVLPAQGASRFHGSDQVLAELLVAAVAEHTGDEAQVGVADGVGAAVLAARSGLVVPPGGSVEFLAALGLGELVHVTTRSAEVLDLVDLFLRLGVRTLGHLASLPAADVLTRFGPLGGWAHRIASGRDTRATALRRPEPDVVVEQELDPPVERVEGTAFAARRLAEELHSRLVAQGSGCGRLQVLARTESGQELVRTWRTEVVLGGMSAAAMTDRVRWQLEGWLTGQGAAALSDTASPSLGTPSSGTAPTGVDPEPGALVRLALRAEEVVTVGAEQGRLWGEPGGADLRARRALHRLQGILGPDAVLSVAVQGGRDLRDQVHAAPWGEGAPPPRTTEAPWPGRLPPPAPATVLPEPEAVRVHDADGCPVGVTGRLVLSGEPAVVHRSDGRTASVRGWAGPWPVVQRWWDPRNTAVRRRAYLQVTFDDGDAALLVLTDGSWAIEASYD